MKILVVEDDRETCRFYQTALETEGHQVDTAFSGEEALAKDAGLYNIILVDIGLPGGKNGIQVCETIRENNASVPICMVTISLDPNDVTASFRGGANGYIVKPFDLDELFARIDELTNPGY